MGKEEIKEKAFSLAKLHPSIYFTYCEVDNMVISLPKGEGHSYYLGYRSEDEFCWDLVEFGEQILLPYIDEDIIEEYLDGIFLYVANTIKSNGGGSSNFLFLFFSRISQKYAIAVKYKETQQILTAELEEIVKQFVEQTKGE